MGTSLSYSTVVPVPDRDRQAVVAALRGASRSREWWAESILLFDDPGRPGHVCGDTKLFCLVDDVLADCFMAVKDAEFIIETLEAVSNQFSVDWDLSLAGEPAGKISSGMRDDAIQDLLSSFDLVCDAAEGEAESYDREELLRRYPDR